MEKYDIKIGRWGGEEFFCVSENIEFEEVAVIVENIRKIVSEQPFDHAGRITCSFGITKIKADDTYDSAFCRVDTALYQAKNQGRNKVITL